MSRGEERFAAFFSNTPPATTPLSTEPMLVLQGGITKQTPASQVSALKPANGNLIFFVSNLGSDSNPGTMALPFATIQHAINVALSFSYGSLYTCTIKVANGNYSEHAQLQGLLYALVTGSGTTPGASGSLIGNVAVPANVVIAPSDGNGQPALKQVGGAWLVDGFKFLCDTTDTHSPVLINATSEAVMLVGTIIISTNAGATYSELFLSSSFSVVIFGKGTGTNHVTIDGDGAHVSAMFDASVRSRHRMPGITMIFSSPINLAGGDAFACSFWSDYKFDAITFMTPGNVTNGAPLVFTSGAEATLSQDPSTVTWPGGAFPTAAVFDETSNIDGVPFAQLVSGAPVDGFNLYHYGWGVFKDTTKPTGQGFALWVDDEVGGLLNLTDVVINQTPIDGGTDQRLLFDSDGVVSETSQVTYDDVANQLLAPNGSVIAATKYPGLTFAANTQSGIACQAVNLGFWESGRLALDLSTSILQFRVPSDFMFSWSAATDNNSVADTGLARANTGVVSINAGAVGTGPGVLNLTGTTVGGLPGAAAGYVAHVTDGTPGLTFGQTVTGGHSTHYLVWYNGTNWTVIGV